MKKLIPVLLAIFCSYSGMAQEGESSFTQDSLLAEQTPIVLQRSYSAPVNRLKTDEKINDAFAKFGDPISSLIFWAPGFGDDLLIGLEGGKRGDAEFYDNPPFQISYETSESADLGATYSLRKVDGKFLVSYPKTISVKLGESFEVAGSEVSVDIAENGYQADSDELKLDVSIQGGEVNDNSFVFSTPQIEEGASVEGIEELNLTFTENLAVASGEMVSVNGVEFTIEDNPESKYSFDQNATYTFQVVSVSFLPIVIIWLLLGALGFTIYFRFVNIRKFKLAVDVVRGKYTDPEDEGEVSHFQALTAALSGTVGLGNIAGVAIAISVGGAGATFWMILAGLLGMSSKFVECTLGVKFRQVNENGEVSGGPMYYLSEGLKEKGWPMLGKIFAIFFAIMCIGGSFGGGNMFQVNQAFKQFSNIEFVQNSMPFVAENGWIFGVFMAALVAIVIIGGIQSIAKVTDKIVPFMCGIYVIAAIVIIAMNAGEVPRVFGEIFAGAFSPTAIAGGFVGVLIQGFRRAAFSNEAGVGSASIAHAAVKTKNPASEGIVALLEPFIDTVVVCTMTALVIIITNNHLDPNAANGVELTSAAFSSEIPFFKYILAVAVILFAFSTMITWSYYGLKSWTYLFGDSQISGIVYKVLFCLFVVVGAAASLGSVTDFSDAMIFAMAFVNIPGLVLLSPVVKEELSKYISKIKSGEIVRVE
ncbi:alanine/glycine:cation symporter family protein [Pontibacter sp. G13]|uniref:alanine/glycine:cation symporter family protein n=1 Tax=Pontibacter sp. G13 TaxID=3074898 RepID=UPI002889858B|nr:alanine/glycine:cation symporter family protein [Pontibacter sp. G13]WNJ15929.1 alanine/glycine:cation symporter family protein [Pontibacter sp. G13]